MPTANAKGTATFIDLTNSEFRNFTIIFAFPFCAFAYSLYFCTAKVRNKIKLSNCKIAKM
jgi:hypothetical protein